MLRKSTRRLQEAGAVGAAMAQFSVCRQPWNEYIKLLSKEDGTAYHAEKGEKPMYRGHNRGREGFQFSQQVQQHYSSYSDERVFKNLTRWRHGDTVGDIGMQQFRSTQPFDLDRKDPHGFDTPGAEVYMKLNYKNPATFSRFLTRTGHFYPTNVLAINPEALKMIRMAKMRAQHIGIYPKFGNPFWHRSQQHKPKPYRDQYDPLDTSTKHAVEQFANQWLQNHQIKSYFKGLERMHREKHSTGGSKSVQDRMEAGYNLKDHGLTGNAMDAQGVEFSDKNSTVSGLMTLQGLRAKNNLYSFDKKKARFGINPIQYVKV